MPKYIELEAAIQAAKEPTIYDLTDVPEWLSSLPTTDGVLVGYGRWEIVTGSNGKEYMICTECRKQQTLTGVFTYCPNCGVRMDGDTNG